MRQVTRALIGQAGLAKWYKRERRTVTAPDVARRLTERRLTETSSPTGGLPDTAHRAVVDGWKAGVPA